MKTISKCISAVLFRLTASIGKSKGQDSLSDKLKTNRLSQACRHDPTKNYSTKKSGAKLKRNPKWFVRFARMAGYSVFILFSVNSYLTTTVHAASIVKTFKGLDPVNDNKNYKELKSDIYEVWVKPIWYKKPFPEYDGILDGVPNFDAPFNPEANGFKKSFTYKSVNDVRSNDADEHSRCYQYYYQLKDDDSNPIGPVQFRSESIRDENSESCNVALIKPGRPADNADAYENIMTHTNNWTTFDVGNDVDLGTDADSYLGAVRVYIQLNSGHDESNQEIEYDIRPKHSVTEDEENTLGNNYKYIKVRKFGEEYVMDGLNLLLKNVLVLDVLQPQGSDWSGQFSVSFNDAKIIDDIKSPYNAIAEYSEDVNFQNKELKKHPLFIFANPLPKWYRYTANKSDYDGCPKPYDDLTLLGLPNGFYTPPNWKIEDTDEYGKVVDTATELDADGVLNTDANDKDGSIRKVDDFILKSNSKRLCIPGGVYVKGRIIHNNKYHTDQGLKLREGDPDTLSPGHNNKHNNATGVKIVGRGILSGIHIKHRADSYKYKYEKVDQQCIATKVGGTGWNGHLIDIRHQGEAFTYTNQDGEEVPYTDIVKDEEGNEADCYSRSDVFPGGGENIGGDVNCVQGITMVDSPKTSIYSGGSRMDVENVKIMSWHIETNGIGGSGDGSKIKNVFIKANDDAIVIGKSGMNVDNATIWRQRWGSVINLSWKLKDTIKGSRLNKLNVIRFDKGQTTAANGNAAIVTARNLMGGTIEDFKFEDIVVEEAPYEIINFQLDDEHTYKRKNRKLQNQLDGTGNIRNVTFDGLFTPEPYKVKVGNDTVPSIIQKSVFSIFDELQYKEKTCFDNGCGEEKCIDPDPENTADRSISDIQLDNICIGIDNGSGVDIRGITASSSLIGWDVNTNNYFNWGVLINDYFKFRAGVNTVPESDTIPPSPPFPYEGYETGFNGIRGMQGLVNNADICAELKTSANMCTLEKLREFRNQGLCPTTN